ncbi:MAG: heme NO-binding domain-containing protein [Planctomycetota bacterium]
MNKAIESLINEQFGAETWTKVRKKAGVEDGGFMGMDPYDDAVTYSLVGAASEVLETPAEQLLESFGEFWTLYTANEGYGGLLEMSGSTLEEFLQNLDEMHARIALSMPELQPPSFHLEHIDDERMALHYTSERAGLEPMVRGLIRGLGKRFETPIEITQTESTTADGRTQATFEIRVLEAAPGGQA